EDELEVDVGVVVVGVGCLGDWRLCVCFFFQAEDGIRDLTVTGVQTCALPISAGGLPAAPGAGAVVRRVVGGGAGGLRPGVGRGRSEERRVGKEWRAGRATCDEEKKIEKRKAKEDRIGRESSCTTDLRVRGSSS